MKSPSRVRAPADAISTLCSEPLKTTLPVLGILVTELIVLDPEVEDNVNALVPPPMVVIPLVT